MADSARALSSAAAEAVRGLNHLTNHVTPDPGSLEYASDVYDVIANLALMAQRLPQLFAQLTRWLDVQLDDGRIGVDAPTRESPTLAVRLVSVDLEEATTAAHMLAAALTRATDTSSHLTTKETP